MGTELMKKNQWLIGLLAITVFSSAAFAANPQAGREKTKACAACHGPDGNSASPEFPRLAGQNRDYIEHALLGYKSGKRKNPIMAPQAANLSKSDIADIAAFYAGQTGLTTKR
jgi:cytochrome c553